MEEQPITRILIEAQLISYIFADQDPYVKYGLSKVTPSNFHADPKRYVLQIDFPDYPACPVGNVSRYFGFDELDGQHVWPASSILKDSRLTKVEFNIFDTRYSNLTRQCRLIYQYIVHQR